MEDAVYDTQEEANGQIDEEAEDMDDQDDLEEQEEGPYSEGQYEVDE